MIGDISNIDIAVGLRSSTLDRRRQKRVVVELPVQIWGMDTHARPFTESVSVSNISGRGATLQGVKASLKRGAVLDLQYKGTKAQFRVAWLGRKANGTRGEVGIENLSNDVLLWDIDPLRCAAGVGQG